jgi:hypothetical protein
MVRDGDARRQREEETKATTDYTDSRIAQIGEMGEDKIKGRVRVGIAGQVAPSMPQMNSLGPFPLPRSRFLNLCNPTICVICGRFLFFFFFFFFSVLSVSLW